MYCTPKEDGSRERERQKEEWVRVEKDTFLATTVDFKGELKGKKKDG